MTSAKYILFIAIGQFLFMGCLKIAGPSGTASVTIVNAVVNSYPLVTNFTPTPNGSKVQDSFVYYHSALQIGYGSGSEVSSYSGNVSLSLSQISDTTSDLWSGTFNLSVGSVHTFILTGADTLHIDTLFTTDNIPYYPFAGDSVTGVRFLHASPGSSIMVDIQGQVPMAFNTSLAYKAVSGFQSFPATEAYQAAGYVFEFRDATSGNILASYPLSVAPFKSQTLVFCGSPASGQEAISVANY